MSVVFEIKLRCDFCDTDQDEAYLFVQQARLAARSVGWRKRKIDGKWLDICDECQDQQHEVECRDALTQAVSA